MKLLSNASCSLHMTVKCYQLLINWLSLQINESHNLCHSVTVQKLHSPDQKPATTFRKKNIPGLSGAFRAACQNGLQMFHPAPLTPLVLHPQTDNASPHLRSLHLAYVRVRERVCLRGCGPASADKTCLTTNTERCKESMAAW